MGCLAVEPHIPLQVKEHEPCMLFFVFLGIQEREVVLHIETEHGVPVVCVHGYEPTPGAVVGGEKHFDKIHDAGTDIHALRGRMNPEPGYFNGWIRIVAPEFMVQQLSFLCLAEENHIVGQACKCQWGARLSLLIQETVGICFGEEFGAVSPGIVRDEIVQVFVSAVKALENREVLNLLEDPIGTLNPSSVPGQHDSAQISGLLPAWESAWDRQGPSSPLPPLQEMPSLPFCPVLALLQWVLPWVVFLRRLNPRSTSGANDVFVNSYNRLSLAMQQQKYIQYTNSSTSPLTASAEALLKGNVMHKRLLCKCQKEINKELLCWWECAENKRLLENDGCVREARC